MKNKWGKYPKGSVRKQTNAKISLQFNVNWCTAWNLATDKSFLPPKMFDNGGGRDGTPFACEILTTNYSIVPFGLNRRVGSILILLQSQGSMVSQSAHNNIVHTIHTINATQRLQMLRPYHAKLIKKLKCSTSVTRLKYAYSMR